MSEIKARYLDVLVSMVTINSERNSTIVFNEYSWSVFRDNEYKSQIFVIKRKQNYEEALW